MCPVAAITITVETSEMTIMAVRKFCITPHESMSPTVVGMNIIGIMYMRNLPVSLTADSLIVPVHSAVKSMSMPYMLPGIGRGITLFSSSPKSDMAIIISNCMIYFIFSLFPFCEFPFFAGLSSVLLKKLKNFPGCGERCRFSC